MSAIHDDPDSSQPRVAALSSRREADPGGRSCWPIAVEQQARVFSLLWAIAHLAHLLRKGDRSDPFMWMVLGAAILLLDRPTSRWRLGGLAAAQLAYLYVNLPATDNHLYIIGFVNLGLLVALALVPRERPSTEPLILALPYVRLAIVIAYGAAALAKLNHGFFDRADSCAVTMLHDATAILGGRMPDVPERAEALMPFLVAGTELAVPLLLLVPRTRLLGVAVLVTFHLGVSLSPTATAIDFTVILFALGFLFLPAPVGTHLAHRVRAAVAAVGPLARLPRTTTLVILTAFTAAMIGGQGFEFATVAGNRNWLWLSLAALVLGGLLLDAAWQAWRQRWDRTARIWPAGMAERTAGGPAAVVTYAACVLLLLANAASPYLGGKTQSNFTMYSNLQTEQMSSNHFLFPRVPIATGQDDLVLVVDSSNRSLRRIGEDGRMLTWHELRRRLAADSEARIQYLRAGELVDQERAADDPELVTLSPIAHRFIVHRTFDPERPRCQW